MGAVFGWCFTVWVLLFWSLDLSNLSFCVGLMEVYQKDCPGTESDLIVPRGNDLYRYEQYRKMYENCTVVRGNLEIVFIELTDEQYDFDFLETIREVNGYVLIFGNWVDRIRLSGLRVIRGMKTFTSTENGTQRNFSLYVAKNAKAGDDSVGLKELNLTSLVEITNGSILFKNNRQLCFGEATVDWNYILDSRRSPSAVLLPQPEPGFEKRTCSESCHEKCAVDGGSFCWGRGPDMCQAGRSCYTCADRCHQMDPCCHRQCIGGCSSPDELHCVACRNFIKEGRCIEKCNESIYNRDTQEWEMPPTTYIHGTQCVKECPGNMLIENGECVAVCSRGYMEKKERNRTECVPCVGSCPVTCRGTDYWLHSKNKENFRQCTTIKGNLQIKNATLYGNADNLELSVDDLEILMDVEEITGFLEVDVLHPNLTSLSFLRNLRVIGGAGTDSTNGYSMLIKDTKLQSLNLKSLHEIEKGNVGIAGNSELCYVYSINWARILTHQQAQNTSIMRNSNSKLCEEKGQVCLDVCSDDGCWGPGDDNCVSCRNYFMEGRCVSTCIGEDGFYSIRRDDGTRECRRCHEQCHMGCNGDGNHQCVACKHVLHNGTCVSECPSGYYRDLNGTCQQCHRACEECYGEGSLLSANRIRSDGCKNCQKRFLMIENSNTWRCLVDLSECDKTFYVASEGIMVGGVDVPVRMETCRKCHPQCDGCKGGQEATDCTHCRNYKVKGSGQQENGKCVSNCSYDDGYYDAGNKECRLCDPECKHCYGPSNYQCSLCRNVRIYTDYTPKEDLGNDTLNKSYCAEECPPGQTRDRNVNETEWFCSSAMESRSMLEPKSAISIFVFLFLIIVLVVVIFAVFWRKQKLRRLKKSFLVHDEIPMIGAGNAKPDMSLLRLIKESELRRGNVIGSGAFGTVYKGIWIPEKENIKIPVAIKVLQDTSNTSQNVELLDEARIMASVCHPYCVRILAVCMTAQMMLITQLMPLGCLLDYVRKEKSNIGSRALLLWSVQIAKGMRYLEEVGIVHRDLAARNVLVQSPNQVKITDFGLAKLLDYDEEEIHSEGGKMPIKWLALECIQHRIYTHKSDVWSYGVTLWEMFTYGERPYENLAARQIPQALEKGERLPQPNICTIDVYMTLIKCWMLDVDSRPTFSDLVNEFTRMAQDPGRFLMIPGDTLMRLPSSVPDAKDLFRLMSLPVDEPDLMVLSGDEYLRPKDLDFEGDASVYPSASSPLGPLSSIPEDDAYVNTRPQQNDDDLDQKPFSKDGKIQSQYSRQGSQRYIADPCRSEPDQTSNGLKNGDAVGQTIRVDKDGYLPPQSMGPSYLDVVYTSENDPVDSPDKQCLLDNNQQNLGKTNIGFARDNPEYYEGDANYLIPSDCSGSEKQTALGASEKSSQNHPEYCNDP